MAVKHIIYIILLRIYKFLPFKKQICLLIRFLKIPNRKFNKDITFKGKFKVNTDGNQFKLNNHTSTGRTLENDIFWHGLNSYEPETIWLWEKLSKKSKVIFDIGANTGIYSLISKTLNPDCILYTFEPVRRTYKYLLNNIKLNNFKIHSYQTALSDKSGKQLIYDVASVDMQYSASLNPMMLKGRPNPPSNIIDYEVETLTLDNFIELNKIINIDLIKLDVEMHEPEVLNGYKNISKHRPVIIIEVLKDNIAKALNDIFVNSDYLIFHLPEKNTINKISRFDIIEGKYNFVLCPKEKEYLLFD